MSRSRRIFAALVVSSTLVWTGSAAAQAAGNPDRQPLPTPPDVTISCAQGFAAVAHAVTNNEYLLTFTSADGTLRFSVNGNFTASVSGNGKTFLFNASGPGTFIFRPDGSESIFDRGRGLIITPDLTDVLLFTGKATFDAGGNVILHEGSTTDICALLAG